VVNVVPIPRKPTKRIPRPKLVHQFLVVLSGTNPLVWRRIQVPEKYSFWDLHVAIQDAMGWLDYHLHEFRLLDAAEQQVVSIGIPTDDDPEDRPVVPGWQVLLSKFFDQRNWHAPPAMYASDFGDDWQHVLVHEGFESADDDRKFPRAEFLQVIADPDHEEHESTLRWAGGSFDPEAFDPAAVKFDDPKKRWKKAFERRPLRDFRKEMPP
jgi:hypothetical protein